MTTTASIRAALENLRDLPARVVGWDVEVGTDASQEPAVWVWATLEDDDAGSAARAEVRERVRAAVRDVSQCGEWVYVRFRLASEAAAP